MPLGSIIGHANLVELLLRAVARNRVPQSLLFAGPEGVGKRTTAIALAQAVNCPVRRAAVEAGGTAGAADACGTCPTCRRIERGQHSDVVFIDRGEQASIKIDVLRDRMLSVIGYRPFEAARRVYIIDPADDLTESAQDALLKTLEEPPRAAIIILIAAYPDTLRATIQSRCRRLRFGPLADHEVEKILVSACGVKPDTARLLTAVSGGSVSRAMADKDGDLTADRDVALGLLVAAARGRSVPARLKASVALAHHPKDRRARETVSTRLAILASLLRDLGALAVGAGIHTNADVAGELGKLRGAYNLDRVANGYAAVQQAQTYLDRNASAKTVADWVGLEI